MSRPARIHISHISLFRVGKYAENTRNVYKGEEK